MPITKTKPRIKIKSGLLIFTLVGVLVAVIGLADLYLAGAIKWPKQNTNNTITKNCVSDFQCRQVVCPQVVGGNQPKCDLTTKTCYCGGSCGDNYCDSIEKRDKTCPVDCNKCSDGTAFGKCSGAKPLYCDNGDLVNKCNLCGCPTGLTCQVDGTCQEPKCEDGTPVGNCSTTKPLYCDQGNLINNCGQCGCPAEQSCQTDGTCQIKQTEAYFKFDKPPGPATFIFKLIDPAKIKKARDILSGVETTTTQVMGYIVEGKMPYNPPYNYYLNPDSISFFQLAMELCDEGVFPEYPRDFCEQFPVGQCTWCPWRSRLLEEVKF